VLLRWTGSCDLSRMLDAENSTLSPVAFGSAAKTCCEIGDAAHVGQSAAELTPLVQAYEDQPGPLEVGHRVLMARTNAD